MLHSGRTVTFGSDCKAHNVLVVALDVIGDRVHSRGDFTDGRLMKAIDQHGDKTGLSEMTGVENPLPCVLIVEGFFRIQQHTHRVSVVKTAEPFLRAAHAHTLEGDTRHGGTHSEREVLHATRAHRIADNHRGDW